MVTGPVQLLVLGFDRPQLAEELVDELDRLRDADAVRVIDALAVCKDAAGGLDAEPLGIGDEATGDLVGALAVAPGGAPEGGEDIWDVLADLPPGTGAVLVLLEHRWAIPLRNAIRRPRVSRSS